MACLKHCQAAGGPPGPHHADPLNCHFRHLYNKEVCHIMNIALMSHDQKEGTDGPVLHRLLRRSVQAHRLRHQHHRPHGRGGHRPARQSVPCPTNTAASSRSASASSTTRSTWCCSSTTPAPDELDDGRAVHLHAVRPALRAPWPPTWPPLSCSSTAWHGATLDWREVMNPNRSPLCRL